MVQDGKIIRVLISSPNDVPKERQAITDIVHKWNAMHSIKGVILEPVKWETHSTPGLEGRPQEMLNKQLLDISDFLVGVFWTRLGTPTGKAESGTVEEILEFQKMGKTVLLYFSGIPVVPDSIDAEQYAALKKFRERMKNEGLYDTYQDIGEFREKLLHHINTTVEKIVGALPDGEISFSQPKSSDKLNLFFDQLRKVINKFSIDWETERGTEPVNTDNAKYILEEGVQNLLEILSQIKADSADLIKTKISESIMSTKALIGHRMYLDGGKSYREFWEKGDAVIKALQSIIEYPGLTVPWEIESIGFDYSHGPWELIVQYKIKSPVNKSFRRNVSFTKEFIDDSLHLQGSENRENIVKQYEDIIIKWALKGIEISIDKENIEEEDVSISREDFSWSERIKNGELDIYIKKKGENNYYYLPFWKIEF